MIVARLLLLVALQSWGPPRAVPAQGPPAASSEKPQELTREDVAAIVQAAVVKALEAKGGPAPVPVAVGTVPAAVPVAVPVQSAPAAAFTVPPEVWVLLSTFISALTSAITHWITRRGTIAQAVTEAEQKVQEKRGPTRKERKEIEELAVPAAPLVAASVIPAGFKLVPKTPEDQ